MIGYFGPSAGPSTGPTPVTRAASASVALKRVAPNRHKVVMYSRDLLFGNIAVMPKGLWLSRSEDYRPKAREILAQVHYTHHSHQMSKPVHKRILLETSKPAFADLFVD